MKTKHVFAIAFLVLGMVLVATGCATPATVAPTSAPAPTKAAAAPAEAAPKEISIGAVVTATGPLAASGDQIKKGYELAVETINKAGGIDWGNGVKVPLKLTLLDDESDATKTVQRMETLFNDNKVALYLGGSASAINVAGAGVAEKNKVPFVTAALAVQAVHNQGLKYLFSPFTKNPQICAGFFQMTDAQNPKPTKFAIFAEKTDSGAEVAKYCAEEATKRNYTLVVNDSYAPGATDYTAMITKARDGGAEVVIGFPTPVDGIAMVKQMKELGFNPKAGLFIRAADSPTWMQSLSKDGDFFLTAPGWHPAVKFPGAADMNTAHQAKYGGPALAATGPAYAVVQVAADALTRAKSIDREKIREALIATNMMTVEGPVKFNADGTSNMITVIDQWQGGKQELVWPPEHQTKPLVFPAPPFSGR